MRGHSNVLDWLMINVGLGSNIDNKNGQLIHMMTQYVNWLGKEW